MRRKLLIVTFNVIIASFIMYSPCSGESSAQELVKQGVELYNNGKFNEALEKYNAAIDKSTRSDIINYNAGLALYKKGEYEKALEQFNNAMNTEDRSLEAKASYSIGNSKYNLGKILEEKNPENTLALYNEAAEYYKRTMDLDENDADAKYNYEFVKEEIKKLKEKIENQKKEKEKEEENKNKEEEKDKEKEEEKQIEENKQDEPKKENEQNSNHEQNPKEMSKEEASALLEGLKDQELSKSAFLKELDKQSNQNEVTKDW
ncbi:hypothetical protein MCHI_001059 [Candidatus Magnetoovum chiemensis]|nr:hypothetical protein MCHI_001059 [Candidatus Magnetoovum chiemensis]